MLKSKFKVGDNVRVIGYGGIAFTVAPMISTAFVFLGYKNGLHYYDITPKIVGKKGVVDNVIETQGIIQYSLSGIPEKYAWYNEDQLELI